MPGIRTLPEMVAQVRLRADMENTQFVTDAEIEQYLQDSYGELYDLLIESAGVDFFRDSLSFDTTANTSDYALNDRLGASPPFETPAAALDVYKVVGVDVLLQGYYRPIRPGRRRDTSARSDSLVWANPDLIRYHVFMEASWPVIRFTPAPTGAYTVLLHYIPSPADLAGTGSSPNDVVLNSFAGWDEYLVVDAAAKCLEKEESDARHLYKRKAELEARIRWHAQTMNQDGAGRVRNVDADPSGRIW